MAHRVACSLRVVTRKLAFAGHATADTGPPCFFARFRPCIHADNRCGGEYQRHARELRKRHSDILWGGRNCRGGPWSSGFKQKLIDGGGTRRPLT